MLAGIGITAGGARAATGPAPDLVVRSLSGLGPTYAAGGQIVVRGSVANTGRRRAVPSLTRFYLSRDRGKGRGDVRLHGGRRVPALRARRRSGGRATLTIPAGTLPGLYHLLACADDRRKI